MNETDHDARQDRPIGREHNDKLERGSFVDSLVRALVRDEFDDAGHLIGRRSTGFAVGLTGKWGLGKSSVLNLLSLKLSSMSHVVVATFNPWLFKGRDELLSAFFNELRDSMGRSKVEKIQEVRRALDKYWGAVDLSANAAARVATFYGIPLLGTLWEKVSSPARDAIKPVDRSPQEERRALEKKLEDAKVAVVVLIDELDRVEDEDVRAVAQLVKAVGDIKGISYLVAYDPERVADALGRGSSPEERQDTGARYLEKIIQHPIPLRPLFSEDVRALLDAALADHGTNLMAAATEREKAIIEHLLNTISTPREVKRLIGAFAVLDASVRGEVSPYDVLSYCWILTKSPSLREVIANDLDKVVDDPAEREMVERIVARDNQRRTAVEVLGEVARPHEELLGLLFPRFGEDRQDSDGTAISRRRNLVRLLYLGNPPGMVSRAELERLWSIGDAQEMEAELRALKDKQALAAALDRLDDILPEMPQEGDRVFWPALSRALTRQVDFAVEAGTDHSLADDAATMLLNLGSRNAAYITRAQRAVEHLIDAGDLLLAPHILRKHMFVHGLTRHGPARGGRSIYSAEQTEALLRRESPRYRAAVMDGTALRRLTNVEAVYVLGNSRAWDEELRTAFTGQLTGRDAIATVATLLVPPGHGAERDALNELFNADAVFAEIERLGPLDEWPYDVWVRESVRRLKAILERRDPNLDGD